MKKAKFKIVPSDVCKGNWHIYRKDTWWWNRLPEYWESFQEAEEYIRHMTSYGVYYDAKGHVIATDN